jgi:selenocysteine lyase/cysteine desulfurase
MNTSQGILFSEALTQAIKDRFHFVDHDMNGRERLFFDNAGGSFRLKSAVERFAQIDALPDCPERIHELSLYLQKIQADGTADLRTILNAKGGAVYASLTASGGMFDMVRAVAENVPGTNMVTTTLEHPSSFDAITLYAQRTGKELRVAKSNPVTGGVDVEEIVRLIDGNTTLLSVIYASNISGAKLDVEEIVKQARAIKPDLYIIVDAVQHAPHGLIDLQKTPVDGINIAPYKFFGCRGSGLSWVSDRAALLPHHKLAAKSKDFWDLGSAAPWQFGVVTEIVNYVCWLGSQFVQSTDRRTLFVRGIERIELHERALLSRLLNGSDGRSGLRHMVGVKVFLDHKDLTQRDLILAIGIDNLEHAQAVREYEKRGVIVYERVSTSLYSKRMLESFGLEGAIRVSPLHCNSAADIDRFLHITRQISMAMSRIDAPLVREHHSR